MTTLKPNDVIEFSITHQIKIDTENSWVKLGITRKIDESDLTTDKTYEIFEDLYELVNNKLLDGIDRAVLSVTNFNDSDSRTYGKINWKHVD